ncbi:malonic semialdehyde reductase [Caulobacter sp. S45]|uniref:malonic semialdehyde reductase n=1 Tax=Caulobacter sp. S45 TaxID=1641861 RepID=UPI0015776E8A|nr:malonic semialdehyde reductase [Caulobacter sp. S45]
MTTPLDAASLGRLFHESRSRNGWAAETLPEHTWRQLYELVKYGPTSMNASPARFVFVTSEAGKARLAPAVMESNRAKVMAAPCTVIIGQDMAFYEKLPQLFPPKPDASLMFSGNRALADVTAFRNSSLQGGYLILAARGMGLDVGPMSGFDNAGVDAEFFTGTSVKSNFICALGHGTDESFPRLPRLSFEEACEVV